MQGTKKKPPRKEREQELCGHIHTDEGRDHLRNLWIKSLGRPGMCPPAGALYRQDMIPAILNHEYPDG